MGVWGSLVDKWNTNEGMLVMEKRYRHTDKDYGSRERAVKQQKAECNVKVHLTM